MVKISLCVHLDLAFGHLYFRFQISSEQSFCSPTIFNFDQTKEDDTPLTPLNGGEKYYSGDCASK